MSPDLSSDYIPIDMQPEKMLILDYVLGRYRGCGVIEEPKPPQRGHLQDNNAQAAFSSDLIAHHQHNHRSKTHS